jgi:hypothetical protein
MNLFQNSIFNKQGRNLKLIIFIALNALFFLLFNQYFHVKYETNDDLSMLFLSSGIFSGSAENYLVFINIIYGSILKFLYLNINGVQWYSVLFALIHIISMGVLFQEINNFFFNARNILFAYFFMFCINVYLLLNFQFTTTAGISCLAGFVLLFRKNFNYNLLGIILLVISSLIRFDVTGQVLLTASAFLFIELNFKNLSSNFKNKFYIFFSISALFISFFFIAHKNYIESNKVVEDNIKSMKIFPLINDSYNIYWINKTPEKYLKSINKNEFMLYTLSLYDISKFTDEKSNIIEHMMKDIPISKKIIMSISSLYNNHKLYFLIIITIGLLILLEIKNTKLKYVWILTILISLLLPVYISLNFKYKFRVLLTGLLPFIFASFYMYDKTENGVISIKNYKGKILLLLFLFILSLTFKNHTSTLFIQLIILSILAYYYFLNRQFKDFIYWGCIIILSCTIMSNALDSYTRNSKRIVLINSQIKLLEDYQQKKLSKKSIISYKDNLCTEGINIFDLKQSEKLSGVLIPGWMFWYPFKKEKFNSFVDFKDKYDLLILNDDKSDIINIIKDFYSDNYNEKIDTITVLKDNYTTIVGFKNTSFE